MRGEYFPVYSILVILQSITMFYKCIFFFVCPLEYSGYLTVYVNISTRSWLCFSQYYVTYYMYSVWNGCHHCLDYYHIILKDLLPSLSLCHYILSQILCRSVRQHACTSMSTYPDHSSFCLCLGDFPDKGIPHRRRSTGAYSGNRRR